MKGPSDVFPCVTFVQTYINRWPPSGAAIDLPQDHASHFSSHLYARQFDKHKSTMDDQSLVSTVARYGNKLANQGDAFNLDGTVTPKTSISYTAKSVITGFDSYFPATLPVSLKVPFITPDSTHPNLAFWYTPDTFSRDGISDGTRISEWINIANICYEGHPDLSSCTYLKSSNKQVRKCQHCSG